MKKLTVIFLLIYSSFSAVYGQNVVTPSQLVPKQDFENVYVEQIYTDTLVTSVVIWVKQSVALHRHQRHSEHVFVLEGSADMKIGDENYSIVAGDLVLIPTGTPHSLNVTSREPLKVISVQAPEFLGKDRELIKLKP
jgi:mannose-6-phosphate isomerase-like protein (cupin superfamily)